jgi:hypothetical protein
MSARSACSLTPPLRRAPPLPAQNKLGVSVAPPALYAERFERRVIAAIVDGGLGAIPEQQQQGGAGAGSGGGGGGGAGGGAAHR